MKWLQQQVTLYSTHRDNTGRAAEIGDVLLQHFIRDMDTLIELNQVDRTLPIKEYKTLTRPLKDRLQCYTPAALLATKEAGKMHEISRTGIMQLDFDSQDIGQYDLTEMKQAIFSLPFIAFCALSCTGSGIFALALIDEPYRLAEYAEHVFLVLEDYNIKADTSKGKKPENLRYVSWDPDMLIREDASPLHVTHFKTKLAPAKTTQPNIRPLSFEGSSDIVSFWLRRVREVSIGSRWLTVQQASFTLGGLLNPALLDQVKAEICNNPDFQGEERKYIICAEDCFRAGSNKPLTVNHERH